MRTSFHIANPLTWLCFAFISQPAMALGPQTGIYWNPEHPGQAMYLENQNGTVFAALYGYSNEDSSPEFYISSGPMLPSIDADFIPQEGLYPIAGFSSPLYRVPSGSCFACRYAPFAPAEQIGTLQLAFIARGGAFTRIVFFGGRVFPNPDVPFGELLQRFNFSLGGTPTTPPEPTSLLFPDVRGEWVFTDQSDPMRPAWRFTFSTREVGADLSDFALRSSVAYRDVTRDAVFYCFSPDVTGLTQAQIRALPGIGCEVRQNGVALFWTPNETAIDEFYGTLGSTPPISAGVFRGAQRVIGRRISD